MFANRLDDDDEEEEDAEEEEDSIVSKVVLSKMNNLDSLNTFLTERLMTVAGEIFQVFKEAFSEYQGEIERIKQENRCLREALAEIYNSVEERAGTHLL